MARINIIIPTFNRKECLRRILLQLETYTYPSFEIKITVVVDGSDDGTFEMLDSLFKTVQVIKGTGNWWYTRCINEGLLLAGNTNSEFYLLLNDDMEICQDYLDKMLHDITVVGRPAILGSLSFTIEKPYRLTFSGIKRIIWWRAKQQWYLPFLKECDPDSLSGIFPSIVLPGRGMLISAEIIKTIGTFESRLPQYGSDDEFCLRAQRSGFPVYISWNTMVFSHYKMTGLGTSYLRQTWWKFLSSYFDEHSRNYWKNHWIIFSRYGNKFLFPLTFSILILGDIKSFLKYRFR